MELSPGRDTVTGGAGTTLVSIQPNIAANQTRAFAGEATDTGHSIGDRAWEQAPIPPTIEAGRLGVWIVSAALFATVVKLAIAYSTFGTNDAMTFYLFARSLSDHGLEWTYQHGVVWMSSSTLFNHPPLTAFFFAGFIISPAPNFCGRTASRSLSF